MDEQVAVSRDQPCKVVRHEADRVVAAAELGLGRDADVEEVAGVGVEAVGVRHVVLYDLEVVDVEVMKVEGG